MNYKPLFPVTLAVLLCPALFAQKPGEKQPLTQADLLKQIEAIAPTRPSTAATKNDTPSAASLFDGGDPLTLGVESKDKDKDKDKSGSKSGDPDKKSKGATEITALEATFNQKANLAIFIGEVVVKDPEFNVICDKLTAHMKHDDKGKSANGTAATTPKPATPAAGNGNGQKQKGGGLERAIAETTSDRRVIITQDKAQLDGTITHSVGKADKATYNAITGDILLEGSPDVVQNTNRVQATAPHTIMILNRDGRMRADGPHKTTIVDSNSAR